MDLFSFTSHWVLGRPLKFHSPLGPTLRILNFKAEGLQDVGNVHKMLAARQMQANQHLKQASKPLYRS